MSATEWPGPSNELSLAAAGQPARELELALHVRQLRLGVAAQRAVAAVLGVGAVLRLD